VPGQQTAALAYVLARLEQRLLRLWHHRVPGNAGQIKRRPEVEALLVARDNGKDAVKEILDWLMERIDSGRCSLPLNTTPYSQID